MATAVRDFLGVVRELAIRDGGASSDGELLEAFIHCRNEPALSTLVRRHSAMVWGVCRRLLGVGQDAEDAFQATFLVLIKKASSISDRERVANWLYGVAQQTSVRMRALRAKRADRERQVDVMPERTGSPSTTWREIEPFLDEELSRLPEKYRTLIVLCDLQERPRSEVAKQLGCPEGTVAGRLARARELLGKRLTRRGIVVSASALATAFTAMPSSAAQPALMASILQMHNTGVATATVTILAEGVLHTMFLKKIKYGAMIVLSVLALVGGGSALAYAAYASNVGREPIAAPVAPPDKPPLDAKPAPKFTMAASAPVLITPDPVNLPEFSFWETKVQYRNDGDKEIVLYPFVKLSVTDGAGKPVDFDARIGLGFRPENWAVNAEKAFLVIPPGKTADVVVNLGDNRDFLGTFGWKFKQPGVYKIALSYEFDRKKFDADHFRRLSGSDEEEKFARDPARIWYRAVEMQKSVTVEMKIAK